MISGAWPMCSPTMRVVARAVVGVIGKALSAVPPRLLRRVHVDVREFGHCQAGFGSRHVGCPSEVCGLGVGAVATMAPLFVVDFAPKAEMEPANRMAPEFQRRRSVGGPPHCGIDRATRLQLLARCGSIRLRDSGRSHWLAFGRTPARHASTTPRMRPIDGRFHCGHRSVASCTTLITYIARR